MPRVLAVAIVFLILAIATGILLPAWLPAGTVAGRVADEVGRATGLHVAFDRASLPLLPTPALQLDGVVVSSADGNVLARAVAVRLPLSIVSLVTGRFVPDGLSIIRPSVDLAVDAAGHAAPTMPLPGLPAVLAPFLAEAPLSSVSVLNGHFGWSDARSGRTLSLEGLSLDATVDGATDRMSAWLGFTAAGLEPKVHVDIGSLRRLATGAATDATISADMAEGHFNLTGGLDGGTLEFKGHVGASIISPARLAAALGVPAASPVATTSFEGELQANPTRVEMSAGKLIVGDQPADVSASVDFSLQRPRLDMQVDVDAVDMTAVLSDDAATASPTGQANPLDVFLGDFGWFAGFDGHVGVGVASLRNVGLPGLPEFTDVHGGLDWHDGSMTVGLERAKIAGGMLSGTLELTPAATSGMAAKGQVKLQGAAIAEALGVAPALTGRFGADLEITAQGSDWPDFAATMAVKGSFGIEDGTLDLRGPLPLRLEAMTANVSLPGGLPEPAKLTGHGRLGDHGVSFEASTSLRALIDGGEVPVGLSATAGATSATFTGKVDPGQRTAGGALVLKSDSAVDALSLFGVPLVGLGTGALDVDGDIEASEDHIRYALSALTIGRTRADGTADVSLKAQPETTIRLAADSFDLGALVSASSGMVMPEQGGWPSGPIDWSRFQAARLALAVDAKTILVGALEGGPGRLRLDAGAGRLSVGLDDASLGSGKASGELALDADAGGTLALRLELEQVSTAQVMTALTGASRLDAPLSVSLDVKGQGRSIAAAMTDLSGSASLKLGKGTVTGFQLPAFLKAVATTPANGFGASAAGAQSFEGASADFHVDGGRASTDNLRIDAPPLSFDGSGGLDFPLRTVDFILTRPPGSRPPSLSVAGNWLSPTVLAGNHLPVHPVAAKTDAGPPAAPEPAASVPAAPAPTTADPLGETIDRLTGNAGSAGTPATDAAPATGNASAPAPVAEDKPDKPVDATPSGAVPPAPTGQAATKPEPVPPRPQRRPSGLGGPMVLMPMRPTSSPPDAVTGGAVEGRSLPPPCVTDASGKCAKPAN